MIVVRIDRRGVLVPPRRDEKARWTLIHGHAELPQLPGEHAEPIRLLHPEVGDIDDLHGGGRERSDRGESRHDVGDVVHVERPSGQRTAMDGDGVFVALDAGSHLLEKIEESPVPLRGAATQIAHLDRAAGRRRQGKPVRGRRVVPLDPILGQGEGPGTDLDPISLDRDLSAELAQNAGGEMDVR